MEPADYTRRSRRVHSVSEETLNILVERAEQLDAQADSDRVEAERLREEAEFHCSETHRRYGMAAELKRLHAELSQEGEKWM